MWGLIDRVGSRRIPRSLIGVSCWGVTRVCDMSMVGWDGVVSLRDDKVGENTKGWTFEGEKSSLSPLFAPGDT